MAALASGLAVTHAARGAQSFVPTAESASARFPFKTARALQVGGRLFASPNAIRSVPPPTTNWLRPQPVKRATVAGLPAWFSPAIFLAVTTHFPGGEMVSTWRSGR